MSNTQSISRKMTTGPVEDVTPWELHPVTPPPPAPRRRTTGLVEEVTPWELEVGLEDHQTQTQTPPPRSSTVSTETEASEKKKKKTGMTTTTTTKKKLCRHPTITTTTTSAPHTQFISPTDLLDAFGSDGARPSPGIVAGVNPSLSLGGGRRAQRQQQQQQQRQAVSFKRSFSTSTPSSWDGIGIGIGEVKKMRKMRMKMGLGMKGRTVKSDSESGTTGTGTTTTRRVRQTPLTGPLEDVAPWEMDSAPSFLPLAAVSAAEAVKEKEREGYRTVDEDDDDEDDGDDGAGSCALSVGSAMTRPATAAAAGWKRGSASAASLPLCERERKELGRGRQELIVRGGSESYLGLGLGKGDGRLNIVTSMMSNMNLEEMKEVLPWELCPGPGLEEEEKVTSRTTGAGNCNFNTKMIKQMRRSSDTATATSRPLVPMLAMKSKESVAGARNANNPSAIPRDPSFALSLFPLIPLASSPSTSSSSPRGTKGPQHYHQEKGISSSQAPQPLQAAHSSSSFPDSLLSSSSSSSNAPATATATAAAPNNNNANLAKFSTADRTILEELKANIRAREAQFVIKGVGHRILGGGKSRGERHHPFGRAEVPYPRCYDRKVVDLDVWETMFTLNLCKGLTSHILESPPTKVLDIGCGTGTWILHAARTWRNCHFVGLDIVPLHPNLQNVASPDPASRITWVQHNFLDGLPFQHEEFDYVYIKRIALGVPEDKWDKFFEEVHRIMKPGGAFEMIEEDLFFPGKQDDDNDDVSTFMGDDDVSVLTHETSVTSIPQGTSMSEGSPNREGLPPPLTASKLVSTHESEPGTMNASSMPLRRLAPHNPRDHTILEAIWHGMLESRFVNASPLSLLPTYLEYHFKDVRTHPPLLYSFPPPANDKDVETSLDTETQPETDDTASAQKPACHSPNSSALTRQSTPVRRSSTNDSLSKHHHHRSLYVALDETRSDALAPSEILSQHLPPKKTREWKQPHAAAAASTLLNGRAPTIDVLLLGTLNLHLASRAKEIVACSESMWEWVQECQNRQAASNKNRDRSGSIEVVLLGRSAANGYNNHNNNHHHHNNNNDGGGGGSSNSNDDYYYSLTKYVILEMTRDDFDQLLNNFQLDMQDKARLGLVLEERFKWHGYQSEPFQDRKAFDEACRKYDGWLADQQQQQMLMTMKEENYLPSPLLPTASPPQTKTAHSIGGGDPDALLSSSSSQRSGQNVGFPSPPSKAQNLDRTPPPLSHSLPRRQLSRAMRVFVAWKASSSS